MQARRNTLGRRIGKDLRSFGGAYLLALPVIIYYILFHYKPLLGAVIAFKDFKPRLVIWGSKWVGLKYFESFFNSYYFGRLIRNTLTISVSGLLFTFPCAIIFALMINEVRSRAFKRTVQTISYMPHFISLVVVCSMITLFVDKDGFIVQLINIFHGNVNQNLLNIPSAFVPIYILSDIWQETGWNCIIYLAALGAIDPELYEAARIDGANRWQQTLHVTLPGIARTIMLGSAPDVGGQNTRGIERFHIRLGVVQPGENIAVFNDALGTLQTSASFLYSDGQGNRFWYDTRPTLRKTMEDRAQQLLADDANYEVEKRLKALRRCDPFGGIHVCPASSLDVPDEQKLRLVVLPPSAPHRAGDDGSKAVAAAKKILETRGTAPRQYKNTLAFIACDGTAAAPLTQAARTYLAWRSISDDREQLNLDVAQTRETEQNMARADETLKARLQEAYSWLLTPAIDLVSGSVDIVWNIDHIAGGGEDAPHKAARKMLDNGDIITQWAPQLLLMELDRVLWKDKRDIQIKQLWDYLCTYCYLPKLSSYSVLEDAIRQGSESKEYFGIASGISDGRYLDLTLGQARMRINQTDFLVKRAVAADQLEREAEERAVAERRRREREAATGAGGATLDGLGGISGSGSGSAGVAGGSGMGGGDAEEAGTGGPVGGGSGAAAGAAKLPTSFAMSAKLDSTRVSRDVRQIVEEVVSQLSAIDDAEVELTLEVWAKSGEGFPVPTQRAVSENCNTLHIRDYRFDR